MAADFTYAILPVCEMTEERRKLIVDNLAYDEDFDIEKDDIVGFFDRYCKKEYDDLRTVSHLHLCGKTYLLTGGLSWGDPPTDEYDELNALARQIFPQLEALATEDASPEK